MEQKDENENSGDYEGQARRGRSHQPAILIDPMDQSPNIRRADANLILQKALELSSAGFANEMSV
jgi:hypothetical protein